jgi:hypothetical protein
MIYAGRLAGAGCELPKIEQNDKKLERPMSSSGLWWADDDDDTLVVEKIFLDIKKTCAVLITEPKILNFRSSI